MEEKGMHLGNNRLTDLEGRKVMNTEMEIQHKE